MMKNKKKNIFHISCNLKATRPSSFDLFVVATPREKKLMRAPKTKTDDVEKKKYVEKKQ